MAVKKYRGVAQAGSAPGLGPGGRRFESCLPDQKASHLRGFFYEYPILQFFRFRSTPIPQNKPSLKIKKNKSLRNATLNGNLRIKQKRQLPLYLSHLSMEAIATPLPKTLVMLLPISQK